MAKPGSSEANMRVGLYAAIGAVPWMIANAAILAWIPIVEAGYGLDDEEAMVEICRYLFWMAAI